MKQSNLNFFFHNRLIWKTNFFRLPHKYSTGLAWMSTYKFYTFTIVYYSIKFVSQRTRRNMEYYAGRHATFIISYPKFTQNISFCRNFIVPKKLQLLQNFNWRKLPQLLMNKYVECCGAPLKITATITLWIINLHYPVWQLWSYQNTFK